MAHKQEGKKEGKLVRDLIPAIIKASGSEPQVRVLGAKAYKAALRTKLVEEAQECASAKGRAALIEELADMHEVIASLCETEKISTHEIVRAARSKHKVRGGFTKRIFLTSVKTK